MWNICLSTWRVELHQKLTLNNRLSEMDQVNVPRWVLEPVSWGDREGRLWSNITWCTTYPRLTVAPLAQLGLSGNCEHQMMKVYDVLELTPVPSPAGTEATVTPTPEKTRTRNQNRRPSWRNDNGAVDAPVRKPIENVSVYVLWLGECKQR